MQSQYPPGSTSKIITAIAGLVIDDFQLEAALSHQRNWGGKLDNILIELQFSCEEDIARVLSEKLSIRYVDLFEPEIAPDIIQLLKPDVAKKLNVVPVRIEAKALVLAMADPLDIATMDNIRFITGLSIKPVLSMPSEIQDAIRKYYDGEAVDRKSRSACREPAAESAHLEIVREVPDIATTEWTQQQQQQGVEALTLEGSAVPAQCLARRLSSCGKVPWGRRSSLCMIGKVCPT